MTHHHQYSSSRYWPGGDIDLSLKIFSIDLDKLCWCIKFCLYAAICFLVELDKINKHCIVFGALNCIKWRLFLQTLQINNLCVGKASFNKTKSGPGWQSYLIWCGNFKPSWHFYFISGSKKSSLSPTHTQYSSCEKDFLFLF